MKRKISYTKIYSSECKVFAKIVANNFASIFVNDEFQQQVCEVNLINNIEDYVDKYTHDVCLVENTNEWLMEETTYILENIVGDVPEGTIFSHIHMQGGRIGYSFSIGNRKITHDGLIPSMDYIQVLFEEWRQRYQHINN